MTITIIENPEDTYLVEGSGSNFGISTSIRAGNRVNGYRRGLIKFDLSALPSDVTINSAVVKLYCRYEMSTEDFYVTFYRSLVRWWEGEKDSEHPGHTDGSNNRRRNDNYSDQVDWLGGLDSGGESGLDWKATMTDQVLITDPSAWYEWDVAADIQDFVDGVHTNRGWFVLGEEDEEDSRKTFGSEQYSEVLLRPVLEIDHGSTTPSVPPTLTGCCVPKDERGP